MAKRVAFTTLKDHKQNFESHPKCLFSQLCWRQKNIHEQHSATLNIPVSYKSKQSITAKPRTTKNSTEGRVRFVFLPRKLEFNQPDVNIENMNVKKNTDLKTLQIQNQELKDKIQKQ